MERPEPTMLIVLRITVTGDRYLIRAQDLRTGELREFTSWAQFQRYAQKQALRSALR